ncbi:MAG TPA: SpoIIE family protein phosphatase [Tepidisphaeraceae bacterium]|nr:SpoIIE family protein phosphatase [Tepidisphaeraceae bacterium]
MEEAARKFARRILLIHLALLIAVCAIVFGASREVYSNTREQAIKQAESRQQVLAYQTAKGIEAFYRSIINDLDLLRQAPAEEDDDAATTPTTLPTANAPPTPGGFDFRPFFQSLMGGDPRTASTPVGRMYAGILWKQLEQRASHMFRVDRDRMGRKQDRELLRDRGPILVPLSPPNPKLVHPRDILARQIEWLKAVDKPQISAFEKYLTADGAQEGLNLVAVPTPERNRLIVVAVPIEEVQRRFFRELNEGDQPTNAFLVDETGTIMVASNPQLIGREVSTLKDEDISRLAKAYSEKPAKAVATIERDYVLGGQTFPPGLVAIEPVGVTGKKWMLMVVTPLSDVDMVVSRVFKRALFWAVFVVFSMTAILVSSSVQLIRGRIRMERVRHEVLTRELRQAREIQMAWLPRHGVSIPAIDIAAMNHPASHISGDFYNWFELPDGRTVVTIGDVTGHGMSAAFLMATTQLLVHTTMLRLGDPGRTLTDVNRQLCMQVFNGQFVTMLVCVIDIDGQTVEVATAGHYPPLMSRDGTFAHLQVEPQLVLGVEKDTRYETERFVLPTGTSSLVLYTDGVLDARSADGKRFTAKGLIDALAKSAGAGESAQSLLDSIVGRVNQFRGPTELPDDLTMVCIQTQVQGAQVGIGAVGV